MTTTSDATTDTERRAMTAPAMRLGIISALQHEQAGLVDLMHNAASHTHGMRRYTRGMLGNLACVCVLSRIGKVAAAATVTSLIERFDVTHIVFTGVAGAADPAVAIGDIVVADMLVQYDMDATPLFPRFEIPLLAQSHFAADRQLTDALVAAASRFIEQDAQRMLTDADRAAFGLQQPRVHRGLIGSGDEFIDSRAKLAELKTALPPLLAVEMEGAAVAQVCFEFGIPCAVVRTISDGANEASPLDFVQFVERVAAPYALGYITHFARDAGGLPPVAAQVERNGSASIATANGETHTNMYDNDE
jgi:adenosylhomocysteine nucleosidase